VNASFWRARRVLLTGHTGFKGSWLLLLLETAGAEVTGIALKPAPDGLFDQIDGHSRCVHMIADLRDAAAVSSIVESANPEIVLHLAAQPLVRKSYLDPLETFGTNVLGTANLLQAARNSDSLSAIVSVTTDKCYANDGRTTGYREGDRLGGHDPYSNSKACAELVTQCFSDSFFDALGTGVATARAGNVIGGGDYASDRLIPDAVRALNAGHRPELRKPSAVRPWQHVLDPLTGYLLLAEKLAANPRHYSRGWNFGPSPADVASVASVVTQLAGHWGQSGEFDPQAGNHPHEADLLTLDSSMAMAELGWAVCLSVGTAVEWTAQWYRGRSAGVPAAELCLDQIRRYLAGDAIEAAA